MSPHRGPVGRSLADGFFTLALLWAIVGMAMLVGFEFSLLLVILSGAVALFLVVQWRLLQRRDPGVRHARERERERTP